MKKLLFIAILLIAGNTMFSQKIISSKDVQKEIEDLTYIVIKYDSNGGNRSETFVDIGDGLEYKFYDQTARKLRKVFASQTELLNYMNKYGWKFVTFIPGYSQIEKLVFIRTERD
jgi:hypothetical protein